MDPNFFMRIGLQLRFPRFPSAVSARQIGFFGVLFFRLPRPRPRAPPPNTEQPEADSLTQRRPLEYKNELKRNKKKPAEVRVWTNLDVQITNKFSF
jgi:hypothetical protein